MDTLNDIWKEVLTICRNEVSDVLFNMWLTPLEPVKFENDTVIFLINSEFKKNIVSEKFAPMIKSSFERVMGFPVEIDIIVDTGLNDSTQKPLQIQEEKPKQTETDNPFSKYSFDNFIVGNSNNFAYSVSLGVAENPGTNKNPLLIYGRSGLGKTHLLLAIYNKLKETIPDGVILYTTGESFMNELLEGMVKKNTIPFHNKYRNIDALLVDDIQFIQRGNAVQEEFFHTFNALYNANKQLVLTSDVPPREMEVLDERLRTRFEMGIMADVQPPDIDTRKAIILKKSQQLNMNLSEPTVEYIAQKVKNNIRQLEGTVKKIAAISSAFGNPVTLDEVKSIIRDITTESEPVAVTVEKIIDYIAKGFGISPADITSDKRQSTINNARQVTMYVLKEVTDLKLQEIGSFFRKNHSTVLHSIQAAEKKMEESPQVKSIAISAVHEFQDKSM